MECEEWFVFPLCVKISSIFRMSMHYPVFHGYIFSPSGKCGIAHRFRLVLRLSGILSFAHALWVLFLLRFTDTLSCVHAPWFLLVLKFRRTVIWRNALEVFVGF